MAALVVCGIIRLLMYCSTRFGQIINQSATPPPLQHTNQSACSIHYAPAAMDMISHLFTLSVNTDEFGQAAQFYMARTEHLCESVDQPVINLLRCMHAWCTARTKKIKIK